MAERPAGPAARGVAWSLLLAGLSTLATLVLIRWVAPAIIAQGWGAVATVLWVTGLLFFLPSVFVGIPSPVLTKLAIDGETPQRAGRTIGAFYAVGAVGSIGGTLMAGFVFISWLGTTLTLIVVALAYVAMGAVVFLYHGGAQGSGGGGISRREGAGLAALVVAALWIVHAGGKVQAFSDPCNVVSSYYCLRVVDVSREYGVEARLMVLDHLGHGVNVKGAPQRLVSPYAELHDMLARIHTGRRSPFRAFFIGGGAYTLPRAWGDARPDAQIVVAEIDPAVTRLAQREFWLQLGDERIRPVHEDARVALGRAPERHFDVVVGDAFHDIVIPPHLVTSEFYGLIASRLQADGLYLMNVVDNRAQPRLVLSIAETMRPHFKTVEVWVSNETGGRAIFVLAGMMEPTPYRALRLRVSEEVVFHRLSPEVLRQLGERFTPVVLTDDFAPVDRLIGVE